MKLLLFLLGALLVGSTTAAIKQSKRQQDRQLKKSKDESIVREDCGIRLVLFYLSSHYDCVCFVRPIWKRRVPLVRHSRQAPWAVPRLLRQLPL